LTKRKLALAAILVVISAVALVLALGTSPGAAKSSGAFKVAFIYVGPHNDGGWSQAHEQGRLYVQKHLGSKVQTTYKENVPEGPQVATVIDQLIRDGNQMIFATSFGFQPAMAAAAKKNPNVKFEMATGTIIQKNMAEYYGRGEDAIYLSGIAAGAATKSGTVGYVVPFAIPEVIRHTNAFALGVQKAHPGAKVKIIWTNSWFDPAKEKKAAENLHSAGADVIGQNVDSPSAGQYAESQNVPWVGYDSDAQKFAPKSWLTAAVYNWGPYYLKRVKAAMNGTWKTGNYYGSLKDGFTKLAPYGKGVSAATKKLIAQQKALLVSGKWNEFSGPIYDQKGKLRIKKWHRPTFKDI
jgi:basic membrane protein A